VIHPLNVQVLQDRIFGIEEVLETGVVIFIGVGDDHCGKAHRLFEVIERQRRKRYILSARPASTSKYCSWGVTESAVTLADVDEVDLQQRFVCHESWCTHPVEPRLHLQPRALGFYNLQPVAPDQMVDSSLPTFFPGWG
jgi:hypothetical protein